MNFSYGQITLAIVVMTSESCTGYNLCKAHCVTMRMAYRNRVCKLSKNDSITKWTVGQKLENFWDL